jgi:hypothetical protein
MEFIYKFMVWFFGYDAYQYYNMNPRRPALLCGDYVRIAHWLMSGHQIGDMVIIAGGTACCSRDS